MTCLVPNHHTFLRHPYALCTENTRKYSLCWSLLLNKSMSAPFSPEFSPRLMHVGLVVEKVAQVFVLTFWFSLVGTVPQVLYTPVSFLYCDGIATESVVK